MGDFACRTVTISYAIATAITGVSNFSPPLTMALINQAFQFESKKGTCDFFAWSFVLSWLIGANLVQVLGVGGGGGWGGGRGVLELSNKPSVDVQLE